jgi:hypothetical protein
MSIVQVRLVGKVGIPNRASLGSLVRQVIQLICHLDGPRYSGAQTKFLTQPYRPNEKTCRSDPEQHGQDGRGLSRHVVDIEVGKDLNEVGCDTETPSRTLAQRSDGVA